MKNKILYIMVGVPGSGKSTYIKQHINSATEVHISRDAIRFGLVAENESYFSKENEVTKKYYNDISNALHDEKITAVYADATQTTTKSRKTLIDEVFPFGVPSFIKIVPIVVKPDLNTAICRNRMRSGRECVPETVIKRMYHNIINPNKDSFNNLYNDIKIVN